MSSCFYMIIPTETKIADVPWGRNEKFRAYIKARSAEQQRQKEIRAAIGRFMKADKQRNHFATRGSAEQYILWMGLPYNLEVTEAVYAF